MKKEELLKCIRGWKAKVSFIGLRKTWLKEDEQAYRQIVALIKKEVTEEWIEEKAKELCEQNYVNDEARDFICSLVKDLGVIIKEEK